MLLFVGLVNNEVNNNSDKMKLIFIASTLVSLWIFVNIVSSIIVITDNFISGVNLFPESKLIINDDSRVC